jgi:hypothetical protein
MLKPVTEACPGLHFGHMIPLSSLNKKEVLFNMNRTCEQKMSKNLVCIPLDHGSIAFLSLS